MTKIDLITGFLGAGKTTFIRMYSQYLIEQGLRVCILENDFGAVNVDTMFLTDLLSEKLDIEMVAGGCDSDCHRRRFKTKLIAMGMKGYDRIIVEPSGLYDLDEFFDVLYDEPLDSWYEIGSVITIVDSEMHIPLKGTVETCFLQEIANAGICVLSKSQNASDKTISALKSYISSLFINNNIKIKDERTFFVDEVFSEYGYLEFEKIIKSGYSRNDYIKFNIEESGFSSLYYMNTEFDLDEWKEKIKRIFNNLKCGNVTRIKGFATKDNNYYEINVTNNCTKIAPAKEGQNVIIVIGELLNEQEINKIIY